jgi:hypothetical protein
MSGTSGRWDRWFGFTAPASVVAAAARRACALNIRILDLGHGDSAAIVAKRFPADIIHQYAYDSPRCTSITGGLRWRCSSSPICGPISSCRARRAAAYGADQRTVSQRSFRAGAG